MSDTVNIDLLSKRIAERLELMGLTERKASLLATGQPDAIRYIRTRRAMPSLPRLFQIAKVLEVEPTYLMGKVDVNDYDYARDIIDQAVTMNAEAISKLPSSAIGIDSAPVFDFSIAGSESFNKIDGGLLDVLLCELGGQIIGAVRAPNLPDNLAAFAINCQDDSMAPVFEVGSPVLMGASGGSKPRDYILIELEDRNNPTITRALVRRFVGRTRDLLTIQQYNPAAIFQVPLERVKSMYRVITYDELIILR